MKLNNLKIYRYLSRNLLVYFLSITLILTLIIFGNQFFLVLNQSFSEGLFSSELVPLMFYKLIRDMPFILSLSFSLSMVLSLNKFYRNSELIIFFNAGINDFKIFKILSPLIIFVLFLVLVLTNIIVPNAKNEINSIRENASSRPEYIFFKEKFFQEFENGDMTIYSSKIDSKTESDDQLLSNIFLYMANDSKLIIADSGEKVHDKETGNVYLHLSNGNIYENLNFNFEKNISITFFKKITLRLHEEKSNTRNAINSPTEINSFDLIKNYSHSNIKEFLSRFSAPLSLIIVTFFAIIISKTNPREKRNFAVGYVLIAYVSYYNMILYFTGIDKPILEYSLMALLPHVFFITLIFFTNFYKKNFS